VASLQMSTAETDSLLRAVPGIDVALYGYDAPYEGTASQVAVRACQSHRGVPRTVCREAGSDRGSAQDGSPSMSRYNLPLAEGLPEEPRVAQQVKEAVAKGSRCRRRSVTAGWRSFRRSSRDRRSSRPGVLPRHRETGGQPLPQRRPPRSLRYATLTDSEPLGHAKERGDARLALLQLPIDLDLVVDHSHPGRARFG